MSGEAMRGATYLLVHGAWSGAWCWRHLGAEFDRRGVAWRALDLPSSRLDADPATVLADDAACVVSATKHAGPVVVVGHSYGGAVVTEAAPAIDDLRQLIYVAALVPLLGQSPSTTSKISYERTMLDDAIERDGDFLQLNPERAADALYNGCDPEVARWAVSQLTTQTVASFKSARTSMEIQVPTFYIRCSRDRAIDPQLQVEMASRCSSAMTLDSDHSPFLSQPSRLCDLLLA